MKLIRIWSTVEIDTDALIDSIGVDKDSVLNVFHDFCIDVNEPGEQIWHRYLIEIKED